jgi:hypothetical protein
MKPRLAREVFQCGRHLLHGARGYFVTVTLTGTITVKLPAVMLTFIVKAPGGVPPLLGGLDMLALEQPETPAIVRAGTSPAAPTSRRPPPRLLDNMPSPGTEAWKERRARPARARAGQRNY